MYSKARGISTSPERILPPGYRGNCFNEESVEALEPEAITPTAPPPVIDSFPKELDFISKIGKEELLIIALIMVMSYEGKAESDTLLMLILLLFIR